METVQGVVREERLGVKSQEAKNMQFAVTTVVAVIMAVSPSSAAAGQFDSALNKRSDGRSG